MSDDDLKCEESAPEVGVAMPPLRTNGGQGKKAGVVQVYFTSREIAEALAGRNDVAVISITDPGSADARLDPGFLKVLRLRFYDAVPADEFQPALPGLFDRQMAQQICAFVTELMASASPVSVLVHCEYGISRSAAVALFVADFCAAPLAAREYAYEANLWVIDLLGTVCPTLDIAVPLPGKIRERRTQPRL